MGCELTAEYDKAVANDSFIGAYGRQSDLAMEPEELIYLTNEALDDCIVTDYASADERNVTTGVYTIAKAASADGRRLRYVPRAGAKSLLTIENPASTTDKELIIFRDSFGSSIAPFFTECYRKVILVDTRYLPSERVGKFIDFDRQDNTVPVQRAVLNNSVMLK